VIEKGELHRNTTNEEGPSAQENFEEMSAVGCSLRLADVSTAMRLIGPVPLEAVVDRLPSAEPVLLCMPVGDACLSLLPAEQDHLAV
jgi:hypothetical protein